MSAYNAGDPGLIPGSGRSSGEGNGKPLQYSCLENPMDRGAWYTTVRGVPKSRTRQSDFTSLQSLTLMCQLNGKKKYLKEPLLQKLVIPILFNTVS